MLFLIWRAIILKSINSLQINAMSQERVIMIYVAPAAGAVPGRKLFSRIIVGIFKS